MTEFNNNNNIKLVPSTPKTYEVRYLENKQSGLSPAARSKVINKSGSNYLSPWADADLGEVIGYGPTGETKVRAAESKGCSNPAKYEVYTFTEGDYFLGRYGGKLRDVFSVDSGKVKDQDFSRIQERIDEFKSGKLQVWKYTSSSRVYDAPRERTEECIKYEAYFETKLEETIKELKEKTPHYGSMCHRFEFTKP